MLGKVIFDSLVQNRAKKIIHEIHFKDIIKRLKNEIQKKMIKIFFLLEYI